jgi:hypothetical protein
MDEFSEFKFIWFWKDELITSLWVKIVFVCFVFLIGLESLTEALDILDWVPDLDLAVWVFWSLLLLFWGKNYQKIFSTIKRNYSCLLTLDLEPLEICLELALEAFEIWDFFPLELLLKIVGGA